MTAKSQFKKLCAAIDRDIAAGRPIGHRLDEMTKAFKGAVREMRMSQAKMFETSKEVQ